MGSDGSPLTLDLIKLIQIALLLASFQPFSLPAASSRATQSPEDAGAVTHSHASFIYSAECLPAASHLSVCLGDAKLCL